MRILLPALVFLAATTTLSAQNPPRATQPPAPIEEAAPPPAAPEPPAQVAPEPPAMQPQVPVPQPPDDLNEINIDYRCRILVQDRANANGHFSHPHFSEDRSVCHLKAVSHTHLYEEQLDNGVLKRTPYEVNECTYILHNITPDPIAFVVHQPLNNGWRVDSTPAPTAIEDGVASFRVIAKPGQTIHLHVGERR